MPHVEQFGEIVAEITNDEKFLQLMGCYISEGYMHVHPYYICRECSSVQYIVLI